MSEDIKWVVKSIFAEAKKKKLNTFPTLSKLVVLVLLLKTHRS